MQPNRLLYVVQLPPPVHGVAQMNALVVENQRINKDIVTRTLVVRSSDDLDELGSLSLLKLKRLLMLWRDVLTQLVQFRPHAIYVSPVPSGVAFLREAIVLLSSRLFRVKRVCHMHGIGIRRSHAGRLGWLYRLAFDGAFVINLSERVGQSEFECFSLSASFAVPNTLSVSQCDYKQEWSGGALNLLFLSTTFESKGILVLLEAFAATIRAGRDLHLHVVGQSSPEMKARIDAVVTGNHLESRVSQHGALVGADKEALLEGCDLFVHPTLLDYFPLVLLEAMRAGLPIVSTQVGAIPELLVDEQTGLIVEPGCVEELSSAILRLCDDAELRASLGNAARFRFESRYSRERFEQRMRCVYRDVGLLG